MMCTPSARSRSQISLRRRMFPHRRVHRRRNQHRSRTGQISRTQKIVRDSIRKLRNDVCRRRRDDQQIRCLGKCDVSDRIGIIRRIIVDDDVTARKRAKRQWLHKLTSPLRHRDSDRTARSLQSAQYFDGLVGRDAAADAERYVLDLDE